VIGSSELTESGIANAEDLAGRKKAQHGRSADELLKLPVRLREIELGRPVDLLVDLGRLRVIGLQVRCGDRVERFLPLAAATLDREEIAAGSALALLEESDFYHERGVSLRSLRGTPVEVGGRQVGVLDDLVVRSNGDVARVVVRAANGERKRVRASRAAVKPAARGKARR
jgi:hypothetical protein